MYESGRAVGALCSPLCTSQDISALTCHSFRSKKEAVFSGVWHQTKLVFKSAVSDVQSLHWYDNGKIRYPTEQEFLWTTRAIVRQKFNVSIAQETIVRLAQLKPSYIEKDIRKRRQEMDNLWILLQDNEYLLSAMFSERDIFPQLLGTCGPYFAVEFIDPIDDITTAWTTYDSKETWARKLRIAILILEFLEELENGFRDPFHLCDIKLDHFGIVPGGTKLKFIDLVGVYPRPAISNILKEVTECNEDKDCEFYDCRSRCHKTLKRCGPVSNSNLQIVCEKLFLGWRMSNTVLVPGLLMTEHTPAELASILRQCANPDGEMDGVSAGRPRGVPDEEIRKKLYNVLTEIEQVVIGSVYT